MRVRRFAGFIALLVGCEGEILGPRPALEAAVLGPPAMTTPNPPQPPDPVTPYVPGSLRTSPAFLLLTKAQITSTLAQHFGIAQTALTWDEPSLSLFEESRLAAAHSLTAFEPYFASSEALVSRHLAKFLRCAPTAITINCVEESLRVTGKRLFRRSLTSTEVARFVAIARSQGDTRLEEGVRYALVAQLNSPDFLYQAQYGTNGALTNQELATRLSLFLTGATPDEALIDAAERGELSSPAGLLTQVERLTNEPQKTAQRFGDLMRELWRVNRLNESLTQTFFPTELASLEADFTTEFVRSAEAAALQGDWRLALTSNRTFVNRRLAQHYGLSPAPADDATWVSVQVDSGRSGLLSTGAVLAAHSGTKYTSTIHRGLFALNQVLCQPIHSPPNIAQLIEQSGVVLPQTDTVRQRIERVGNAPACAGCHRQFDPVGLVYENFDALGRWSAVRWGAPVDSRAVVEDTAVENLAQLATVLTRDDQRLSSCFAKKLFVAATGAPVPENVDVLAALDVSPTDQHDFTALARGIAMHEDFRGVKTP